VSQARGGRLQIGITVAMKSDQDDRFAKRCVVGDPTQRSLEELRPPEIVGEVANPVLEAARRFWWRAFDRICYWIVLIRLSIHDWVCGPEQPAPADLKHEADYERLV